MVQYIDKSALMAEIEKRMQELRPINTHQMQVGEKMDRDVLMWLNALTWVKNFLDTLEVKEVQEESASEELEEAARDILDTYKPAFSSSTSDGEPIEYYAPGQMRTIFMEGSYWQKEHCLRELMTSDLETAADKYAIETYNMFIKDETTLNNKEGDEILSDAFKAGAEFQKEQILDDDNKQYHRLRHEALKRLYENEAKLELMLGNSLEGYIEKYEQIGGHNYLSLKIPMLSKPDDCKDGDKIKLILIKDE